MAMSLLNALCCIFLIKNGESEPRIVGGNEVADRSSFPFQASLRHNSRHYCGGVVLKIDTVLTAAHCGYFLNEERINIAHLLIVVGDLQLSHTTPYTRMYSVKSMRIHPNYSLVTLRNDIAVVKIHSLFEWNDYVSPINLATKKPTPKTSCVISGWGTQHQDRAEITDMLYYANISIIDDSYCKNYIKTYVPYHDGMFCAGQLVGGIDSCKGDSGGPLICNNELTGIISWGIGCAAPKHPGVYMDIAYYHSWIHSDPSNALIIFSSPILLLLTVILFLVT